MRLEKKNLKELIGLVIGCILLSIGFNMFLSPHTIAPGGLSGFAVVLNKVTNLEVSVIMLILGLPLVFFAYRILGTVNFIKNLLGTIMFSVMLELTARLSNIKVTDDILLSAIFGAVFVGAGLGVVLKADMSTGGTDLIALILNKKFPNIKTTKFLTGLDGVVVLLSGIVTRNLETVLYSAISLYIIVKVIDGIMDNFEYSKSFIIISEKSEEIRKVITKDLDRGLTILKGEGGFTEVRKNILLVAIPKKQEISLKKLVHNIDPEAFMMISDVHEVHGKGFTVEKH